MSNILSGVEMTLPPIAIRRGGGGFKWRTSAAVQPAGGSPPSACGRARAQRLDLDDAIAREGATLATVLVHPCNAG